MAMQIIEVCQFIKRHAFHKERFPLGSSIQTLLTDLINDIHLPDTFRYTFSIGKIDEKVQELEKLIEANVHINLYNYISLAYLESYVKTENKSIEVRIDFINKQGTSSNWTITFKLISLPYSILNISDDYVEMIEGNLLAFEPLVKDVVKIPRDLYNKLERKIISTVL